MAQKSSQTLSITDNINSFNRVINFNTGTSNEDDQIREWLSPLKPQQRHKDVRTDRLDGVGNWLLETSEFRKWSNGEVGCLEQVLFCSGGPGVGKTYLMQGRSSPKKGNVANSLCDQVASMEKDLVIAWLYCDFRAHKEQSATAMLGGILKQLVSVGEMPENIRRTFRKRFSDRGLRLPDMVGMLKTTISLLPPVYICMDALDESAPKSRQELLESLRDIIRGSPSTRVLFTGRSHIQEEIKRYFAEATIILVSPTGDDIRVYLGARLDRDTEPYAMDCDLRRDIMKIIPEKNSEVFRLVSLNMDAILGEMTINGRRKKLEEMKEGKGLGDAYTPTLARIKSQNGSKSRLGMEALMWISHSERPLKALELCQALGVERGDTDQNSGDIPAMEAVLRCSLGLITVEASSSTVRLVHFALQEYLSNASSLFNSPHSVMAETCLAFLNLRCVRDLQIALDSPPAASPFVGYASCYWGTHARKELSESVKSLALNFLDGYDKHVSSKLLLIHERDWWWHRCGKEGSNALKGFTGLHRAAYLGIIDITSALLDMREWDLNAMDVGGNTAFAWAARKGHADTVKMLLARPGVDPDTANADGRTPLLWAAACGHEGVVEMLLGRTDVNPDRRDEYGQTPLSLAAEYGREGVVNVLVKRADINLNTIDRYGRTPLSWAVSNGHEGVVKMLLELADIEPNTRDTNGLTPLSQAAWDGREKVVMMLLARVGINPDMEDMCGQTPLSLAAACGREGTVRILLERVDVSPCARDKDGLTPLSWAAKSGQEGVVKMLLEREDVNPNAADKYGETPLSIALREGHEGVKMLLERADFNPNTSNNYGQMPLLGATCEGHEGVVKTLIERVGLSSNMIDLVGQAALSQALKRGPDAIVELRSDHRNSIPSSDGDGHAGHFPSEPSDLNQHPCKRIRRF